MVATARRDWLQEKGGEFSLTDPGREIVEGVYELCDRLSEKINALSDLKMSHLRRLSDLVIDKIKELPELLSKPAFKLNLLFEGCLDRPLIVQLC